MAIQVKPKKAPRPKPISMKISEAAYEGFQQLNELTGCSQADLFEEAVFENLTKFDKNGSKGSGKSRNG